MKAARRTESCRARLTRLVWTRSRRSRLPRGRAARGRGPRGGIPPEEEAQRERDAAELAMLRTWSEGGGVFTTGVVVYLVGGWLAARDEAAFCSASRAPHISTRWVPHGGQSQRGNGCSRDPLALLNGARRTEVTLSGGRAARAPPRGYSQRAAWSPAQPRHRDG